MSFFFADMIMICLSCSAHFEKKTFTKNHLGKSENSPRYVEIFAQHLCFVGDLSTCTVAEFIVVAGASDKALHWVLPMLAWSVGSREMVFPRNLGILCQNRLVSWGI